MKNSVDFVGVAEKRELSKLLERQFDEAITEAVNLERELCQKAEAEALRKLGVQMIMEEISKLDRQKDVLIERIQELGFDYNHGNPRIATTWNSSSSDSVWKKSTDAAREALKVLEGTTNLRDLKAEKVSVLKKLWLSTSRKEVVRIVGNGKVMVKLHSAGSAPQLTASSN